MASTFNPPPNWPKPPEGWQPPPGWQPDPAWGPAPEGWQLWIDTPQNETQAAGAAAEGTDSDPVADHGSGSAEVSDSGTVDSAAPAAGAAAAGGETVRMPQYRGGDLPTTQQAVGVGGSAPTWNANANQGAAQSQSPQQPQYAAAGQAATGAGAYQAGVGGAGHNSSGGGASGGNRGGVSSKLLWILGGVIALLMVILLVLILALSGIFGGDDDKENASAETSQSQEESSNGNSAEPESGSDSSESSDSRSISEEATKLNVDPEGAKEVKNPTKVEATFNQDDDVMELPRPNGDDAPQLISVSTKGGDYVSFKAEHEDGSEAHVSGGSGKEEFHLLMPSFGDRGPVTKVWVEEDSKDVDFELKVYNLDELQTVDGGNLKGDGSAVFAVNIKDDSTWYKFSHNGKSLFSADAVLDYEDGSYGNSEYLGMKYGRSVMYGEFGEGKWLVSLDADGKWGFEESSEEHAREAAIAEIREGE